MEQFPEVNGIFRKKPKNDPILQFSQCILIDQVVYANLKVVVELNPGYSIEKAMEWLNDKNTPNWSFLPVASTLKLLRLSINNHIYSNARQVVTNGLTKSERVVYQRLVDRQYPNWYWLFKENEEYQQAQKPKTRVDKPIMVDNVWYSNAEAVVKANLAKHVSLVRKRISKTSFPTWYYANPKDRLKGSPKRKFHTPYGKFNTIIEAVNKGVIKNRHELYRKMNHIVTKQDWYYLE